MRSAANPWNPEVWSATDAERHDASLPMITLGVLNYNRRENLRQTLDVLTRAVQYPRYEIVLVDNGSTDESLEMVRAEYPSVRIFEMGENLGVSARNVQTANATGTYLFSFDDDTCPGTPATILRIVRYMESHPEVSAMSSSYYQPITGLMETEGWGQFRINDDTNDGYEGIFVVEGGVCFRLDALRKVDGYEPRFPYGSEGMELGLQLFKQGSRICLNPEYVTLHFISPVMRSKGFRAYANSRHMIWIVAKHCPRLAALPLLGMLILRRVVAMVMHTETAGMNAKGVLDGLTGIRAFLRYTPKLTWRQMFALRRFFLFFFRWG